MSPRPADETTRVALVEAAARVLAEEGPGSLTTRRVAAEVGVSTMALYTYFGGMQELRRAVKTEWFMRLADQLSGVRRTRDPVADLAAQGWAYVFNAIRNEHMFRLTVLEPLPSDPDPQIAAMAAGAFGVLVGSLERCADEGRLQPGDAEMRALQIWMMGNGVISARLAQFISTEDAIMHFFETAASLLVAFGDDPSTARVSLQRGRRRMQRLVTIPE